MKNELSNLFKRNIHLLRKILRVARKNRDTLHWSNNYERIFSKDLSYELITIFDKFRNI